MMRTVYPFPPLYGPDDRRLMAAIAHAVWEAETAAMERRPCICGATHPPQTDCWMKAWGFVLPPVEDEP